MQEATEIFERRTTADVVFDALRSDIVSLNLLPGTKLSEVDVARRFGVSRQPVRDAFSRLANLDLILIRPQKATEVRGFSMERIAHARFVRLSVELEVIRRACTVWDQPRSAVLAQNIEGQRQAIDTGNDAQFHALDYEFHKHICYLAGYPLAFETIEECKQKVDRLCVLSLGREREVETLWQDHCGVADALTRGAAEEATTVARRHLGRLDDTIDEIHQKHSEYFE
ncbi:GntR family transcriptional regulator [Alisedimentitalea sp. MJ-SS2]|uniref:GntR family transcriptional regulator n=1 Tax=Aliisedimentitalea sp. MJ-SS2 TaxID=3049795 RepID=UPI00290B8931|nr:GntR family transcriptional regulator [Alisedimentitalea sp. MJ-SS2]MDU8928301.1 GntR family transcriptional regulator [Alisedimentitalea sp. MJ-SS2]